MDKIKKPTLVIVDEAGHAACGGWSRVIKKFLGDGARVIGLSASPKRLSGEGLDDLFEFMVQGPSVEWLIENGYLSQFKAFAPYIPDLSKVHSQAGDYRSDELEAIMDSKAIIADVVQHYNKISANKRALVFCTSIKHSNHVVEQFNANGILARHLDGTDPAAWRKECIRALSAGEIKILSSVNIFSEGLDIPACDTAILLRPTQSLSMFLQQIGRVMRRAEGKEYAIIQDHCGNLYRHGLPDHPHVWTLEAEQKRKSKKSDEALETVRQCPNCFCAHSPSLKQCPACGHVYEVNGRQIEEVKGDLKEVTRETTPPPLSNTRIEQLSLPMDELLKMAKEKGLPSGKAEAWAAARYSSNLAKKRAMRVMEY